MSQDKEDDNKDDHDKGKGEKKTVTIVVEGTPHEWPKNTDISSICTTTAGSIT